MCLSIIAFSLLFILRITKAYEFSTITNNIKTVDISTRLRIYLTGRHLIAATSEHVPHVYTEHHNHKEVSYRGGSHVEALRAASAKFNFTYDIIDTGFNDWNYGIYVPENKSWTGMVGKILGPNPEAHFTLHCRFDHTFSFLPKGHPMTTSDLMFYVRPGIKILNWYSIFQPLEISTWMIFFFLVFILGVMQTTIMYIHNNHNGSRNNFSTEIVNSIVLKPLAIVLDQADRNTRGQTPSVKITSLLILFGSLVIGTGYKGILRQNLLFPKVENVPTTVEELIERDDYTIRLTVMGGIEKNLLSANAAAGTKSKILKSLSKQITIQDPIWYKCFEATFTKAKTACIVWTGGANNKLQSSEESRKFDPIILSKDSIYSVYNSYGFPPGSNLTDCFKWITASLFEAGLFVRWEQNVGKIFQKKLRDLFKGMYNSLYKELETNSLAEFGQNENARNIALRYQNIWILFVMMGIFNLFAFVVFLVEVCLICWRHKKENRVFRIKCCLC